MLTGAFNGYQLNGADLNGLAMLPIGAAANIVAQDCIAAGGVALAIAAAGALAAQNETTSGDATAAISAAR